MGGRCVCPVLARMGSARFGLSFSGWVSWKSSVISVVSGLLRS